jgi:hypothetical protein
MRDYATLIVMLTRDDVVKALAQLLRQARARRWVSPLIEQADLLMRHDACVYARRSGTELAP